MRPFLAAFALLASPLLATTADAGPKGGGGGNKGGGALSRVSSGIRAASSGGARPSGGTQPTRTSDDYRGEGYYCYDLLYREIECRHRIALAYASAFELHRPRSIVSHSGPPAKVSFYAGAQKVHDSDGSASIELAVTDDRFRIGGTFTRYFERQPGGGVIQMSMPTLMGGVRIDDMGATSVVLEGGVVHARTNGDQMGNSSITGPIAGLRVEHSLSREVSMLGDVQQMWFDNEIRATAGRVGVRYRYVQASFRVLDFNVGPALFGPEVGVRF